MEFIKKHLITILSVVSIVLLFLPLITTSVEMETSFLDDTQSTKKMTGFSMLAESIVTYLLLVGPALLVAMNYINKLGKHKGTIAIAVPVVCIIALIIVCIQAGRGNVSAESDYVSMETKVRPALGMFLLFADYVATIIAGAITYHNFSLDKVDLDKIKVGAGELISVAQEKVVDAIQMVSSNIGENHSNENSSDDTNSPDSSARTIKPASRRPVNINHTEEILTLIEKLAKMRDSGILTDEEFTNKKQQLLEEI